MSTVSKDFSGWIESKDNLKVDKAETLKVDFSDLVKTIHALEDRLKDKTSDYEYNTTIKKVDNGYILETPTDTDEGDGQYTSYEVVECNGDEKETMKRLLEAITDYFGEGYNKFAKDNLNITWDKFGHKVDDGKLFDCGKE